jgi:hypothetical protein
MIHGWPSENICIFESVVKLKMESISGQCNRYAPLPEEDNTYFGDIICSTVTIG